MEDARLLNSSSGDRNSKASILPETIKIQAVIVCPRIITMMGGGVHTVYACTRRMHTDIVGRLEASQLHMARMFVPN